MIIVSAVTCLALTIYHEARNQNVTGQFAVAMVVRNRSLKEKDNNICHAAFASKQFSWANKVTRINKYGYIVIDRNYMPERTDHAWQLAKKVAMLSSKVKDFTHGSTHYHTKAIHPYWEKSYHQTMVLGNHIFYKEV